MRHREVGTETWIESAAVTGTTVSLRSVARYKTHEFEIQAQGDGVMYAPTWGDWAGDYIAHTDVPPEPTGLALSNITSDSITVSWDHLPGVLTELRYREAGEPVPESWVSIRDISEGSYVLTGLEPHTQYNFRLRAWGDGSRYLARSSSITEPVSGVTLASPS